MILRFFKVKHFIITQDDKIAAMISSRREENQLQALQEELKDFESVSSSCRAPMESLCSMCAICSTHSSSSILVYRTTSVQTLQLCTTKSSSRPASPF
ncbi:hypothetical protein PI125_g24537 [Phytophthora idaei]|nr:hypothetical protein PI125_g24537 [Phytophthora idaei]